MRGKHFVCQESGCWKNFLLCIKCIKYKATLHPKHSFQERDMAEFEELDSDTEDSIATETEVAQGEGIDESEGEEFQD